jgi:uncharacterized protein (DUF885 family)
MRNPFIFIAAAALLASCGGNDKAAEKKTFTAAEIEKESKRLNEFLDRVFDEAVDRDPMHQSYLGIKKDYDKWSDISDERAQKELEITKAMLDSLHRSFDPAALDEQSKLSYRLFESESKRRINGFEWRFHNYPVNQMDGLHNEVPAFLINIHGVTDEKDALAYISRLSKVNALFDQLLVNLKAREEKNIIPPKFVFPYVLSDLEAFLTGQPFDKSKNVNPLLEDFTAKVNALSNIDGARKKELIAQASDALVASVKPAYEKLTVYIKELEKKATTDDGAWKLPSGEAYYNHALSVTTTTSLTADQIHEIGLKEVERIHGEMRAIMKKVNFKSDSLQEFFTFMRTGKQFYYTNDSAGKKAYLAKAVEIIATMKGRLDELFITKPKADIVVKAVEPFREKSAGGAFYQDPALDGSRPGIYYVNLYNMADQAIYQMEALAYHEGIPGHHMQLAIAQELQGIPKFRKLGGNTAYVEGWALYSELIPKELGFYSDPYSDFGRLAMELFRAARLVVDTGIHKKKWTREQALEYFITNTPNPEGDCRKEIERYIVWPSQATGYKIGMNKILELRAMAKSRLGDKFDIRGFHDVVLTNGPVTMDVLEELVNAWVEKQGGATKG